MREGMVTEIEEQIKLDCLSSNSNYWKTTVASPSFMCYTSLSWVPGHVRIHLLSKSIHNILEKSLWKHTLSIIVNMTARQMFSPWVTELFFFLISVIMMFCWLGAACFMGIDFQINVCFHTCATIIGACCICCFHGYISHDAHFWRSLENQLKGYILLQIENNKTALARISLGVSRQTGSQAAMWLAGQLVQNLRVVTSLGGIKGVWLQHLNLPVAPSQQPKCLTDSQVTAGDTTVKYYSPHSPLCSVQFVNEQSAIKRGTYFITFFKHCLHLLQYYDEEVKFIFQNKGLIEGATDRKWERKKYTKHKCLVFPTCLFVLRASFGMHGVKTIINGGIESFNSTDLLGQTQAWSLFVSVVVNQRLQGDWIQSSLLETGFKWTQDSHFLEIFVNNTVKIEWIGTSSVWATWFPNNMILFMMSGFDSANSLIRPQN